MQLKTFEEALQEAQEEKEERYLSKIGKAQSYFTLVDGDYKDVGNFKEADAFLAGDNTFIIDKTTVTIADQDVFLATDDYDKNFQIYIDSSGVLYTEDHEKAGLYKKILQ